MALLALTLALALCLTQAARLRIYGASQPGGLSSWTTGPQLRSSNPRLCPSNLPSPFTLVCLPDRGGVTSARFLTDGQLMRTERVAPYTIAGDFGGVAQPWRPTGTVAVRCELSNGEVAETTITFSCGGSPASTPPPTTTPPTTRPNFGLNSGSAAGNCVRIPARSFIRQSGWTLPQRSSALFFRPGDRARDITSAGTAVAEYRFTAPANGRYGFTLDMDTRGGVDHNDVWVEFPAGGFLLTRQGRTRDATGWTKAYHNENGRSNQVFSVDFDPHTFATKRSLTKGTTYTVKVSGRSTMTGFFSVVLFPCGNMCDGTDPENRFWRTTRDTCA